MSRRSSNRVSLAPMAVAADGAVLVNAYQLSTEGTLAAVIEAAASTGLDVFVGVVVSRSLHRRVLRDIDDAAADVVGRLGPHLLKRRGRRR